EQRHVPAGDERHLLRRRRHPERVVPLPAVGDAATDLLPRASTLVAIVAVRGGLRPVARTGRDHRLGLAARHPDRGHPGHRRRTAAARRRAAHEREVVDPERGDQRDLVDLLDVVRDEPVDLVHGQARVVARGDDGLAREVELGAAEVLRVRRLADADNGGSSCHQIGRGAIGGHRPAPPTRNWGSVRSSSRSTNVTATGSPTSIASLSMSTRLLTMNGPSSSCITTALYGAWSANAGSTGG